MALVKQIVEEVALHLAERAEVERGQELGGELPFEEGRASPRSEKVAFTRRS